MHADIDVAIIGGGPAGASTSLSLASSGAVDPSRIAVFERKRHPREKYCGGALSAWGVDVLRRLGCDHAARGVPIRRLAIRANGRVGDIVIPGLGVVVRRAEFDGALAAFSKQRGVRWREDDPVRRIVRVERGFELVTDRATHRARLLVGADGASGFSRSALGLSPLPRHARLLLSETPGPEPFDRACDHSLVFSLDVAGPCGVQGYYWDFAAPLDGIAGTSRGIYHLNRTRLANPAQLDLVFREQLHLRGVDLDRLHRKAHSIRPYDPAGTWSAPGAILVGESVGADPVTGEGIAHALSMGELAGAYLARALRRGDWRFDDWSDTVRASFVGNHLRQAWRLSNHVYGPRAIEYAQALASSPDALGIAARWYRGEVISRADKLRALAALAIAYRRKAARLRCSA